MKYWKAESTSLKNGYYVQYFYAPSIEAVMKQVPDPTDVTITEYIG